MLKILMVGNHDSVKGGITTVINQICDYSWEKEKIKLKFIPTYVEKNSIVKILYFAKSLLRIINNFLFYRPSIIHIHMSYKGSFTRANIIKKIAKLFNIKVIVHLHGSEFEKWYNSCSSKKQKKIRVFLKTIDLLLVLGNKWKETIYNIEKETNMYVLPNSMLLPKKKAIYNEQLQVLFLGVLIDRKGVSDLINAVSMLPNDINIKVIIGGTGRNENEYKTLVNKLRLENKISFIGWVSGEAKKEAYLNSQFFVLPSYNEGLPMAILEALSYGIPVISTNVGDITSVIKDKENGYIINPKDVNSLAKILQNITKMDEKEWNKMSNKARDLIENCFSYDVFCQKLINIYREYGGSNG